MHSCTINRQLGHRIKPIENIRERRNGVFTVFVFFPMVSIRLAQTAFEVEVSDQEHINDMYELSRSLIVLIYTDNISSKQK